MEIFSNWVFWVILASIIFVLALIGYLTESMKKPNKTDENKEDDKNDNKVDTNVVSTPAEPAVTETPADDWTTMPEINKPLEEVKVDNINEVPESSINTNVNSDTATIGGDLFANPSVNETVTPVDNTMANSESTMNNVSVESPVNTADNTVEPTVNVTENTVASEPAVTPTSSETTSDNTASEPVQSTPVETLNTSETDDKNTDIWNL